MVCKVTKKKLKKKAFRLKISLQANIYSYCYNYLGLNR